MAHTQFSLLGVRRFLPLFATQALGAFNDNVFKNALVILITYSLADRVGIDGKTFITVAAGLFIAPFFLFSATAGQLADKYDKARLIRHHQALRDRADGPRRHRLLYRERLLAVRRPVPDGDPVDILRPAEIFHPAAASGGGRTGRRQCADRDRDLPGDPARHPVRRNPDPVRRRLGHDLRRADRTGRARLRDQLLDPERGTAVARPQGQPQSADRNHRDHPPRRRAARRLPVDPRHFLVLVCRPRVPDPVPELCQGDAQCRRVCREPLHRNVFHRHRHRLAALQQASEG